MLEFLLGIDKSQHIVGVDVFFRRGWVLALVLIAAAIVVSVLVYRRERALSVGWRRFLTACHIIALLLLVILVLQPVAEFQLAQQQRSTILVLLDTSESMDTKDQRQAPADMEEVATLLDKSPATQRPDNRPAPTAGAITPVSRFALARAAIEHPKIKLVDSLAGQFNVRFFTFDDQLRAQGAATASTDQKQASGETAPLSLQWLRSLQAQGATSRIGSAIDDAVARYAGQPIAGVVVISDFAWIKGKDPVAVAKQLSKRGIPIYPVVVGLPSPPDIQLRRMIAPEVVFTGDRVPLRVQIDSTGYKGKTAELALTIDGDTEGAIRRQVELTGDVQFEQVMFTPKQKSGFVQLDASITPMDGEASRDNNQIGHKVRILDEKIKVLYIEGMPRWEYRYLRWVLLRDPRLDVTFLMTQGDPELAKTSPQHLSRFPQDAKDAFKYDLIIVGDVPASYFKPNQAELIDGLVRKSGGSLLMVAGPMAAPTSYRDTKIGDLLPVNIGTGQWQYVKADVHPVVTAAGRESLVTTLGDSPDATDRIWSRVGPLYALPPLNNAKPGATTLLSLPTESAEIRGYPLVAWQRIGSGKSMFVGTEDLWRMRLEVGSRYHARFWGQTIQFLTLSRLLGQNKQITLETDRMTYDLGQRIKLFANVLTESFEPVVQPSYTVVVERGGESDAAVEVELAPLPHTPGLYSGAFLAPSAGAYKLLPATQDVAIANVAEFQVIDVPLEKRQTAADRGIAQQIANLHGREPMTLTQLADLSKQFRGREPITTTIKREQDLWDVPLFFILLVVVAGLEWYVRRRHNLV